MCLDTLFYLCVLLFVCFYLCVKTRKTTSSWVCVFVCERDLIDNQEVTEGRSAQRPVGSHGLWALGLQHMTASTIPPLSVWPCGTPFGNTQEIPDRLRSAPITDPVSRGFGIPNRSPDPLVQRAGRDHPFPVFAGSPWRERDVARRMRHG